MKWSWDNAVDIGSWVVLIPIVLWLFYRAFDKSTNRVLFAVRWVVTGVLVLLIAAVAHVRSPSTPLVAAAMAVVIGLMWTPAVADFMLHFMTGGIDGGPADGEAKPFYFTADAKRRKGDIEGAIADIQGQLEKFPDDYEGHVKLATIYMENLRDASAAEQVLTDFIALPKRPANEVVAALHFLADWQLQHEHSAAGAERFLRRVAELYPGTPMEQAALQRIAHLVDYTETQQAREAKFVVKPGIRDAGLRGIAAVAAKVENPQTTLDDLVDHLNAHPADTEARERLAFLYASEFHRLDVCVEQLEQLIALPSEPAKRIAHWLNVLATVQIRFGRNLEAADTALRRIMDRFPGTSVATIAQARRGTLAVEFRAGTAAPVKALGIYEKDIGIHGPQN